MSKLLRYSRGAFGDPSHLPEESQGIQYFRTYLEALRFVGRDLENTELQPADDLALLAANSFVQAWVDGEKSTSLMSEVWLLLNVFGQSHVHHYTKQLWSWSTHQVAVSTITNFACYLFVYTFF